MDEIEKLKKENEELKLQNATKSDLISISAHQLRTTLSATKWILKMFLDGDFGNTTPEQTNFMQKAYDSGERMLKLVNEMLSLNHTDDSLEAIHTSNVDVVKLLDESYFDFTGESYKKGIELIFLKPAVEIPEIVADPEKVRVVFQNLIENAIKYSPRGGRVFINIAKNTDSIEVSVRDTGIGIKEEDQPKIFGKFFRASNAKEQDSVGSGFGLYTTKRIVEKHNGKIWFESKIGEGTTFHVTLPIGTTH